MFGEDVSPDALAFTFALIGGFSMGTYPVPIKAPSVLKANVHPMIFQCYKSFWVFVLGFGFIFLNLARGQPAYVPTYWGILGAAAWIPSGLGTIAAVPRLGVGMAIVINTGTSSALQFLTGFLVGEGMKKHGTPPHTYVLAPYYLVAIIIGMAGLVLSPTLKCKKRQVAVADVEGQDQPLQQEVAESGSISTTDLIAGLLAALMAGIFSALQFAVITIGKKHEDPCPDTHDCPGYAHFKEEFDSFGSYMTSFGIGAGLMTSIYLSIFAGTEKCQGKELPQSHFQTLRVLGSIAGWCWVAGNCFQSAAVNRGGSSVMGPANQAIQLITSGAWGLLWYKEVKEPIRIVCWLLSAAWTIVFVILLGQEKA